MNPLPNNNIHPSEILESSEHLHRFFVTGFTAADIAVPLQFFDSKVPRPEVRDALQQSGHLVAALCDAGKVVEIARLEQAGISREPLVAAQVAHSDTSLAEVAKKLDNSAVCIVTAFGAPAGYIVPSSFHKPPARMWLFGIITLLEMRASVAVEKLYTDASWRELISPGRVAKAEELHAERARIGQPCDLLDCLQITDKADILVKTLACTEVFGMTKRQFKDSIKSILSLRNNLAHAQDFIPQDWPTVVMLANTLDERLLAPKLPLLFKPVVNGPAQP